MFNLKPARDKAKEVEEWLRSELARIRTGRAAISALDSVKLNIFNSQMSINMLASLSIENPYTVRIEPWDKASVKEIERAIAGSNLGLSVNTDDKGLRVIFPELTSERREQFVKLAKQKLEEARISLRLTRDKVWEDIQNEEKKGGMGEDDKFRLKDDLQKIIDDSNRNLDRLLENKVKEISA
jgi:ribosome recycling factor